MSDKNNDCLCGDEKNCQCDDITLALGEKTKRLDKLSHGKKLYSASKMVISVMFQ